MPAHELKEQSNGVLTCTICGLNWKRKPSSDCVGLPVYKWASWPEHLLTKKQLSDAGYSTTSANLPSPSGAVFRSKSPDGIMWLYDRADGVPKSKIMSAASIAKAKETRYQNLLCKNCGEYPAAPARYVHHAGFCQGCDYTALREGDRFEAIQWARDLLEQRFLVLDTETSGLSAGYNEIVEIAIADSAGKVLLNTRIKPLHPERLLEKCNGISSSDIHGIKPDDLLDAPTFKDIYPKLADILTGSTGVIYNLSYDAGMLDGDCHRHGLPEIELENWHCAMEWYAQFYGEYSKYHGSYRWQPLDGGDHSALGDVLATLDLLRTMAQASP